MEKLDQKVLYCDTDAIIFILIPGEYEPQLGNYLDQFTNEIESKTHCTIKGFTQNHLKSLQLTYDAIKDLICEYQDKKITVNQMEFVKNKKEWNLK